MKDLHKTFCITNNNKRSNSLNKCCLLVQTKRDYKVKRIVDLCWRFGDKNTEIFFLIQRDKTDTHSSKRARKHARTQTHTYTSPCNPALINILLGKITAALKSHFSHSNSRPLKIHIPIYCLRARTHTRACMHACTHARTRAHTHTHRLNK